jgi:hypothetical protein
MARFGFGKKEEDDFPPIVPESEPIVVYTGEPPIWVEPGQEEIWETSSEDDKKEDDGWPSIFRLW